MQLLFATICYSSFHTPLQDNSDAFQLVCLISFSIIQQNFQIPYITPSKQSKVG